MFNFFKFIRKELYLNSSINIIDNTQIIIENCKNILECNDIIVRVLSAEFIIDVWGSDLTVTSFANRSVMVDGEISSVSLNRRRNEKWFYGEE